MQDPQDRTHDLMSAIPSYGRPAVRLGSKRLPEWGPETVSARHPWPGCSRVRWRPSPVAIRAGATSRRRAPWGATPLRLRAARSLQRCRHRCTVGRRSEPQDVRRRRHHARHLAPDITTCGVIGRVQPEHLVVDPGWMAELHRDADRGGAGNCPRKPSRRAPSRVWAGCSFGSHSGARPRCHIPADVGYPLDATYAHDGFVPGRQRPPRPARHDTTETKATSCTGPRWLGPSYRASAPCSSSRSPPQRWVEPQGGR
jgi:hypothetical protein